MATLFSVGSIHLDVQVRVDQQLPVVGLALAHDLMWLPGGKAANVAVIAARLGAEVRLVGAVGDDDAAERALEGPRAAGIDLAEVRRIPGPTGLSSIVVGSDGDKAVHLFLGANDEWAQSAEEVARLLESAAASSVLVADLECPPEVVVAAARGAAAAGAAIVVDPSPPGRLTPELTARVDHITPDHHEAWQLTGIEVESPDDALRAARALRDRGVAVAHVKLSNGGCVTSSAQREVLIEAPTEEVVDATGAGDAFAGALGWALLEGADAVEAAAMGVAAATCAVGTKGSQAAYPDRAELEDVRARVAMSELT